MKTMIQQWGNSLALRIPRAFAQQTSVRKGTPISLTVKNGRMVIEPLKQRKYSLKQLVSKITPQNRHPETDWGKPTGKEAW
jgi:antitoxin MazE